MREEWKKLRPATGQNAFSRFQQEEVMSKQFFRRFKNKNANSNIGELHIIKDWDHPEESDNTTTQADDQIAKEATKYYIDGYTRESEPLQRPRKKCLAYWEKRKYQNT